MSGGVIDSLATEKVAPEYPKDAKAQKIQGTVEVEVVVDEEGKVIEAEAIKGHQLLREAATTAAKQWKFKVAKLSGNPVAFSGRITLKFKL
ncbi:MAG: energy transducer TonB [Pyrinomonadaceae bacterium MAG19_C2-C3]|nr:energy transducer TonB [Pyrinomonadaceae bacterium MAG19_C2-C3]